MSVVKFLSKGRNVLTTPIRATKNHPEAEIPFKENEADACWDITVVGRCDSRAEDINQEVNTFMTGLVIKPPPHYHLEVLPHPSLYKAGYMLAGAPLVINSDDEGELILPLYKFRDTEDLELPFRAGLLVLRLTEYAVIATEPTSVRRQAARAPQFDEDLEFAQAPQPKRGGGKKQPKTNHMF